MKYIVLTLAILSLGILTGCDGTGSSPFPSQGHTPGTETILAQGEFSISAGAESQVLGSIEAPGKGLLVAVILWDGEPAELSVTLKHTGSDTTAETSSTSPAAVTANVTDENTAAGTTWEVSVTNPSEVEITATYKVAFLAQ
jgi:hypothetical protein